MSVYNALSGAVAGHSLLLYLAENIPKLKSRQNRPAEGAAAAAPAAGKKGKGKRWSSDGDWRPAPSHVGMGRHDKVGVGRDDSRPSGPGAPEMSAVLVLGVSCDYILRV